MFTTEIINRSGYFLKLREGNAGQYTQVAEINDGESFTVSLDPNSTYKEFEFVIPPDYSCKLKLSSDELTDWEVITIIWNKKGLDYDTKPRRTSSRSSSSSLFLVKFFELFRWTK